MVQDDPIIRLEPPQERRAAELLARAFHNDPMYRVVIPDGDRRTSELTWLFERVVRYCILYGSLSTTPTLEGAAGWLPPGRDKITIGRIIRSGLYATPIKLGWKAYQLFDTYMTYADRLHTRHAPEPHWYLWVIGVDPVHQGKGIGSRLIQPVLAQASADGLPCYLETEEEKNVRFYEKHGFRVVEHGHVPRLGTEIQAMRREPG